MRWQDYIMVDASGSRPSIRGAGIAVSILLDHLASGLTIDEVLERYPSLSREAILAAIAYAAELVRRPELLRHLEASIADNEKLGRLLS